MSTFDATSLRLVTCLLSISLWCDHSALAETPIANVPGVASSAPASAPDGAPDPKLTRRDAPYRVQQGDILEVTFPLCPEFNQQVAVQPDGAISLKEAGQVKVQNETLPALTARVNDAYSSIMKSPQATVSLKDFERPYFIAAGEVVRPGKYDLRTSFTITEALAVAGGFNGDAKQREVLLFRRVGGDNFETRVIDEKKVIADKDLNSDIHLLPGDVLFVSKSKMSHIKPYLPGSSIFLNPFAF